MTASTCSIGLSASQRATWLCALILIVLMVCNLSDEAGNEAGVCGVPNGLGEEVPPVPLGVTSEIDGCEPLELSAEGESDENAAATGGVTGPRHHNSKGGPGTGAENPPHSPLQNAPKQGPPS